MTTGFSTNHDIFQRLKAIFLAAKEDYEGGYIFSIRSLVQAEIFDSELEQAGELLRAGYVGAAAVIAGVVLETALRDSCSQRSIDMGKLDKMNADMAKAGVYSILVQKQITAFADIRNNAAHGNYEKFNNDDIVSMISRIERILAEHLGN
ncbi:MAG: hypothetical protein FD173_2254 [Gallionellaceae bacterium]|nr:MAG: hypothetical protein FD173_2254 [Gallionellaceae bacterium]